MAHSIREAEKQRQRDILIMTMKDAKPKTLHGLKATVNKKIEKLEKNKRRIERMSDEKFQEIISHDIFGVAMKSYYTHSIDKDIEKIRNVADKIEWLIDLRCECSVGSDYIEHETFKGRVKEGISLLDEFSPKKCTCMQNFVKENKHKYMEPEGGILSGGRKEKQMIRDAHKYCGGR